MSEGEKSVTIKANEIDLSHRNDSSTSVSKKFKSRVILSGPGSVSSGDLESFFALSLNSNSSSQVNPSSLHTRSKSEQNNRAQTPTFDVAEIESADSNNSLLKTLNLENDLCQCQFVEDSESISLEKIDIVSGSDKQTEYNFLQIQEERYKISTSETDFLFTPTIYGSETIFIKKKFHFDLKKVACPDFLRLVMVKDSLGAVFDANEVGSTLKLDSVKVEKYFQFFELQSDHDSFKSGIEFFIPKDVSQRTIYFYIINDDSVVLLKGKLIVLFSEDFKNLPSMDKNLEYREHRIQSIKSESIDGDFDNNSIFSIYGKSRVSKLRRAIEGLTKSPLQFIITSDNIHLAYRQYEPYRSSSKANLIIVSWNNNYYDLIAHRLSKSYEISCFVFDIRGLGYSGGERGILPKKEKAYEDVASFVRFVRKNCPKEKPVFLLGHIYSAGLIVNYDSWKDREPVDGYILMSPQLGLKAKETWRGETIDALIKSKTLKTHFRNIILAHITGGFIMGNQPAFTFHVSEDDYVSDPTIADSLSYNLVSACSVDHPRKKIESLKSPYLFLVGEKDELFCADKLIALFYQGNEGLNKAFALKGETQFSLFFTAHLNIGDYIMNLPFVQEYDSSKAISSSMEALSKDGKETSHIEKMLKQLSSSDLDDIVKSVMKDFLETALRYHSLKESNPINYLAAFDGYWLGYRVLKPASADKTPYRAICITIGRPMLYNFNVDICGGKSSILGVHFDTRGYGDSVAPFGESPKQALWRDIKTAILFVEHNYPNRPIFLAGHDLSASIILNYSCWSEAKQPSGGYILISPLTNHYSPNGSDPETYLKLDNLSKLLDVGNVAQQKKSSLISRVFQKPNKSTLTLNNQVKKFLSNQSLQMTPEYLTLAVPKDFFGQMRRIKSPLFLACGANDEVINSEKIVKDLDESIKKDTFNRVELVEDASHGLILDKIYPKIQSWILDIAVTISPAVGQRLENPRLSDFEKLEIIGRGTYGIVWLVKEIKNGRILAMKEMRKSMLVKEKSVPSIILERNIIKDCNSPFIVPYVGSFQDKTKVYILSEYMIGGELYTYIRLSGSVDDESAKFYAAEVVLMLEYLHCHKKIIYRDLKPENLLIDSMGHVRLADFGFARYLSLGYCKSFCGSPCYIAPELIEARRYNFTIDFWALGILAFEMLTGNPPFVGKNPNEVYKKILYHDIEFPGYISTEAKDLISKLCQKEPSNRLGSKKGVSEIKKQKWFRGIDWMKLEQRLIPAPFQPHFQNDRDTGNFSKPKKSFVEGDDEILEFGKDSDPFKDF